MNAWTLRALRLLQKPPGYVVRRMATELHRELDRFTQPYRTRRFNIAALCARTGERSPAQLWQRLAIQPWPVAATAVAAETLERLSPGSKRQILERAMAAARHEVNLLGSGVVALGPEISWDVDFKSGARWPRRYFRDIPVLNAQRPSDIKVPWELSRLQWLIPVAQAYLLSGDERHAVCVRDVLEQWLTANPTGRTVNWALAMEPAMRIFTWTWLFRVFARSVAWEAPRFRERFLCSLYEHAQFVARHLERADVNGNHFTADCAALLVAGAFFGGDEADRWFESAHADLEREIAVQILADGADFEASAAYHRFVAELFLIAALHAEKRRPMSAQYRQRLAAAARFTAAYTKPDGSAPLWGDADDARALPFGTAPVTDHRHLIACTASFLGDADLGAAACGGWDEVLWLFGRASPSRATPSSTPRIEAFAAAGVYVLRAPGAHVFVDCGPVGLAGRGGHGHNDALSFEAVLGNVPVVSDAGCYLYTASFEERNHFRSTGVHSTPQIDGEEINRFLSPDLLWLLLDDARPLDPRVCLRDGMSVFEGAHTGYRRLPDPVEPWRRLELRADGGELRIEDTFRGAGSHEVSIPLQLAAGWRVSERAAQQLSCLHTGGARLAVRWSGTGAWQLLQEAGRVAASYGVTAEAVRLRWLARGPVAPLALRVVIERV